MLITSPVRAPWFPRCSVCLLWGADLRLWPPWQTSTIQDCRKMWLATGSLLTVGGGCQSLGLRLLLAFQLWLLHTCLSASGQGEGPVHFTAGYLSYGICSILCSVSGPGCKLEPFTRKFFLFPFSLWWSQFGLLSHVNSLRLSSRHSGPVLTLRIDDAAHASLSSPHSLVVLHWQLWLGVSSLFLFVCFVFSQLCCLLRFQNPPQTCLWECFLLFGNFFTTPSPGQVSIPNSSVSLFSFYILSYFLLKRMGCLSGCLVFSTSIQKLFCGSSSAFKWYFDEFLVEKVVSLSYSSAIFGPFPYYIF